MHYLRVVIFALLLSTSCDRPENTSTARPTVAAGSGLIRGVVRFIGKPPAMKIIGGDCCPGAAPVQDESLIVNSDSAMKNVVVYIKDGPNIAIEAGKDRVLAQINCQYVPHVLALRAQETLIVTNHDATTHNVHIEAQLNPSQNFPELQAGSHAVRFSQPERVKFKCDVHAWMTAYAYVFNHPCFAVTGEDGRFEIGHLPPGTYTVVVEQEKLGPQQMSVTVSDDKPAEVNFEYHQP